MASDRLLAAIMFADIAGYTSLMQENETSALRKLHTFKKEMNEKVKTYGGEIIQYYGDGCLAIFHNASDAVQCSKELQTVFIHQQLLPVRIGIHSGEIVVEEGNIFGDSVNITSRIQSMGIPGGILFSDVIKNQIRNKPEFQLTSLGKYEFKNVYEPMEVFALSNPGLPVPVKSELQGKFKETKPGTIAYTKGIKFIAASLLLLALLITSFYISKNYSSKDSGKSIAVLAFTDMSPDKSQEYLGDGMADDIITALSGIKDLKVTGRTSSFQFKGKNADLRDIGEKLDVSAVLEGSIQKSGNKIRITAQLIDTKDGTHYWSHKWDRELTDIFQIQDEIAAVISEKLKVTILKKPGKTNSKINQEAYELFLQGRQLQYSGRPLNIIKAKEYFLKAKSLDSSFASTYAYLSMIYRALLFNFPPSEKSEIQRIMDTIRLFAEKALSLDPGNSMGYIALANCYANEYNWIEVDKMARKAHEINPGAAEKIRLAGFLGNMGYDEEALKLIKEAFLLEPLAPEIKSSYLIALVRTERFDEVINTVTKYLELDSANINFWTTLAYAYVGKKQYKEALDAWARQHESYGNRTLANIYRKYDFKSAISAWIEQSKTNKVISSTDLVRGQAYAMLEDKENTLKYLKLAVENFENNVASIKTHWLFDFVREEPRFKDLYRKLNFDAYDVYKKGLED